MVDIVFSLLNLLILVMLAIYVFKKFFLRSIKTKIDQDIGYINSLSEEISETKLLHAQELHLIEKQNESSKNLTLKIELWKKKVDEEKINQEQEFKRNNAIMQQLSKIVASNLNLKFEQKEITPIIINKLSEISIEHFKNSNNEKKYLNNAIKILENHI